MHLLDLLTPSLFVDTGDEVRHDSCEQALLGLMQAFLEKAFQLLIEHLLKVFPLITVFIFEDVSLFVASNDSIMVTLIRVGVQDHAPLKLEQQLLKLREEQGLHDVYGVVAADPLYNIHLIVQLLLTLVEQEVGL